MLTVAGALLTADFRKKNAKVIRSTFLHFHYSANSVLVIIIAFEGSKSVLSCLDVLNVQDQGWYG